MTGESTNELPPHTREKRMRTTRKHTMTSASPPTPRMHAADYTLAVSASRPDSSRAVWAVCLVDAEWPPRVRHRRPTEGRFRDASCLRGACRQPRRRQGRRSCTSCRRRAAPATHPRVVGRLRRCMATRHRPAPPCRPTGGRHVDNRSTLPPRRPPPRRPPPRAATRPRLGSRGLLYSPADALRPPGAVGGRERAGWSQDAGR